jgi:hypothetical protein
MRLLGQILQGQRVHRALEADMHLVDLALGDRHDRNTGKAQALEQGRYILLVAGKPVQRL